MNDFFAIERLNPVKELLKSEMKKNDDDDERKEKERCSYCTCTELAKPPVRTRTRTCVWVYCATVLADELALCMHAHIAPF